MKIAVLGGSFNPIHIGHLILADSVCRELGYDKILFIPVYKPPHKQMSDDASSENRLGMVKAAIENDSRFEAESCEIDRGGISYTWDTVCYLENKYRGLLSAKIGVIFGEDLVAGYHKWEHAEELAEKADLIVACRPRDLEDGKYANQPLGKYGIKDCVEMTRDTFSFPHKLVENPRIQVSSTEIRRKIAEGGAWRYLVSQGVFEYIKTRNLYGFTE